MNKYRIKKVTTFYKGTEFYKFIPQEKVFFWWKNIGGMIEKYIGYSTLEEAQEVLYNYINDRNYPKEEYIEFNPERDCK